MVKRCVVQFCSNTYSTGHSLHYFPKDPSHRRQWVRFVQTKRADFKTPSENSQAVICGAHFTPDCFLGFLASTQEAMAEMGFKSKKDLIRGSIPTIQPVPTTDQLAAAKAPKGKRSTKRTFQGPSASATAVSEATPPIKLAKQSRAIAKREVAQVSLMP